MAVDYPRFARFLSDFLLIPEKNEFFWIFLVCRKRGKKFFRD